MPSCGQLKHADWQSAAGWQPAPQRVRYTRRADLKNAVALITGGSAAIGYSIAELLKAAGARVAITDRDKARLAGAARTLGVVPIHADVSKESDVERTYREVHEEFGDLDILVNNAGFGVFKNLVDFDTKGDEDALDVAHALVRAVFAPLRTQSWEKDRRSHECERGTQKCVRHGNCRPTKFDEDVKNQKHRPLTRSRLGMRFPVTEPRP